MREFICNLLCGTKEENLGFLESFPVFLFILKSVPGTKISTTSNQLKNEFISHKRFIDILENDPGFHKLITNKLNNIFHESGELSSEFPSRRTNEKTNGPEAGRYKIVVDKSSKCSNRIAKTN